jgi:hypothetical protein
MTVKQFREKADAAKKSGSAVLDDGGVLLYCFMGRREEFCLRDRNGNTVDSAYTLEQLEYLYE